MGNILYRLGLLHRPQYKFSDRGINWAIAVHTSCVRGRSYAYIIIVLELVTAVFIFSVVGQSVLRKSGRPFCPRPPSRRLMIVQTFIASSSASAYINSDVPNVIPAERVLYAHLRASSFPVWQNVSPVSRGLRAEGVASRRIHHESWHQYYSQVHCRGR